MRSSHQRLLPADARTGSAALNDVVGDGRVQARGLWVPGPGEGLIGPKERGRHPAQPLSSRMSETIAVGAGAYGGPEVLSVIDSDTVLIHGAAGGSWVAGRAEIPAPRGTRPERTQTLTFIGPLGGI